MIRNILLFILWFVIWIMLSWPVESEDVIAGVLVSIFICFMTMELLAPQGDHKKKGVVATLEKCGWFIVYVFVFLWECLKANIDVARRVLSPVLPIRPGTIKVKVGLRSDIGLTFLANSLTLTPGTTSVDVDKENGYLYVHWLYVREDYDHSSHKLTVVDRFESILERIFE